MENSPDGVHMPRHIKRTTDETATLPKLALPGPAAEAGGPAPFRIVRPGRHHRDVMAAPRQPRSHLAGIFSNPGQFGGEIQANHENAHGNGPATRRREGDG